MIKIEETEIFGWEAAIRGMRNPLNSWEKSDSKYCRDYDSCGQCANHDNCNYEHWSEWNTAIGPNDFGLMKRLRNAGTDHRKFMRMITVYVDITAPLYWWKEADTYRVGVEKNSCSTMHKVMAKEFELDDFSREHMNKYSINILKETIRQMNYCRNLYLAEKDPERKKDAWWQVIQLMPASYNQKRTVMLNYEVLANIYKSRKNHKLDEWVELCAWIEEGLPYSELITRKERTLEYADQPGLADAAQPVFRLGC